MQRLGSITVLSITVFGAAALGGCGDDGDAATPDGGLDAPAAVHHRAHAVSGDFAVTGVFSTLDVEAGAMHANALAGVAGGDPFLRRIGDELFIINRDRGENVTVLGGEPLALIDQYGTGGGSNPQDVAQVGGKLYVPALGTAGVVVVDRASRAITTIAIPGDPDDHPDCVSAYAVGTQVYVACGRLDATFTPRGPGTIAVIDSATDTVTARFELPEPNPVGMLAATPATSRFAGDLLISTAPAFNDFATGCLARVTPGPTPAANGCAVTNQALGGLVNHVSVDPDGGQLWLAVTGFSADFSSQFGRLHAVDLATGAIGEALSTSGQRIDDVAACGGGFVVAADGTLGASGVRIWQDGVETTTAALDIGRPTGFGNNLICH